MTLWLLTAARDIDDGDDEVEWVRPKFIFFNGKMRWEYAEHGKRKILNK